jgi:hypothetical protein
MTLLRNGYSVMAIDAQHCAISYINRTVNPRLKSNVNAKVMRFEKIRQKHLPLLSMVYAKSSLFFCPPSAFDTMWHNLFQRLQNKGIFCGNFLGKDDDWANLRGYLSVSKRQLLLIFNKFDILYLDEVQNDSGTLSGDYKHWHTYEIIARKK